MQAFAYAPDVDTIDLPYFNVCLDLKLSDRNERIAENLAQIDLRSFSLKHNPPERTWNLMLDRRIFATHCSYVYTPQSGRKRGRLAMSSSSSSTVASVYTASKTQQKLWKALNACTTSGIARLGNITHVSYINALEIPVSTADAAVEADEETQECVRIHINVHIFAVCLDGTINLDSEDGYFDLLTLLAPWKAGIAEEIPKKVFVEEIFDSMRAVIDAISPPAIADAAVYPIIKSLPVSRKRLVAGEAVIDRLKPHQIQAVNFMLEREKANAAAPPLQAGPSHVDPHVCGLERHVATVKALSSHAGGPKGSAKHHPLWESLPLQTRGCTSCTFHWNRWTAIIVLERCSACAPHDDAAPSVEDGHVFGGFLCDEPGLGKTIECIALVAANPHSAQPFVQSSHSSITSLTATQVMMDDVRSRSSVFASSLLSSTSTGMYQSRATLVVVPANIRPQWLQELADWCPSLAVYAYSGAGNLSPENNNLVNAYTLAYLLLADVVVVPFDVLSKELLYDNASAQYGSRHPPSFLTKTHFHRIIFDEIQFFHVASSARNADHANGLTKMALRLHSTHRWCVSGTPFEEIEDIRAGLFLLKHATFASDTWWRRALRPALANESTHLPICSKLGSGFTLVARLLMKIMWRNTRQRLDAAGLLSMPALHHLAVRGDFTSIERQHYMDTLAQLQAKVSNSESETTTHALQELRAICVFSPASSGPRNALGTAASVSAPSLSQLLRKLLAAARLHEEQAKFTVYRQVVEAATMFQEHPSTLASEERIRTLERIVGALTLLLPKESIAQTPVTAETAAETLYRIGWKLTEEQYVERDTFTEEIAALRGWKRVDIQTLAGLVRLAEARGDKVAADGYRASMDKDVIQPFLQSKLLMQLKVALTEAYQVFGRLQQPFNSWVDDERCVPPTFGTLLSECQERLLRSSFPGQPGNLYGDASLAWPTLQLESGTTTPAIMLGLHDPASVLAPLFQHAVSDAIQVLHPLKSALECWATVRYHQQFDEIIGLLQVFLTAPSTSMEGKAASRYVQCISCIKSLAPKLQATPSPVNIRDLCNQCTFFDRNIFMQEIHAAGKAVHNQLQSSHHGAAFHKRQRDLSLQRFTKMSKCVEACGWLEAAFGWYDTWDWCTCMRMAHDITNALLCLENMREFARMVMEVEGRDMDAKAMKADLLSQIEEQAGTADSTSAPPTHGQVTTLLDSILLAASEADAKMKKHARWRILHAWACKKEGSLPNDAGTDGVVEEEDEDCAICKDKAKNPAITPCSHLFCSDCISWWLQQKSGSTGSCPVCRSQVSASQLFVLEGVHAGKEDGITPLDSVLNIGRSSGAGAGSRPVNTFSPSRPSAAAPTAQVLALEEEVASFVAPSAAVNAVELPPAIATASTKTCMAIRRILSLKSNDKVVVVSSFPSALQYFRRALDSIQPKVGVVSLSGSPSERAAALASFQTSPTTRVLLLNSNTDCSGLTLTTANHLLLVEPSVHSSVAIQLPGRICRLGQLKPCFVYHMYVANTVEEELITKVVGPAVSANLSSSVMGEKQLAEEDEVVTSVADALLAQPSASA
jgi:hypothetical protein